MGPVLILLLAIGIMVSLIVNFIYTKRDHKKFNYRKFFLRCIPTTREHHEMARDIATRMYGRRRVELLENAIDSAGDMSLQDILKKRRRII